MDTEAPTTDKTYTVLSGGESIFDIALKLGYKVPELMEHNNLTIYTLPESYVLHLPYPTEPAKKDDRYHYELWHEPKQFYIHNSTGSKKYAFGNAKTYRDIFAVGATNPQYKVIEVAGLVTVTFSDDRIYDYYLDTLAIKDGKVKDTIGYPKEYLTEGESPEKTEQIANTIAPEPSEAVTEAPEPEIEAQVEPEPIVKTKLPVPPLKPPAPLSPRNRLTDGWILDKDSYAPLPEGPRMMRTIFACDVPDYSTKDVKPHWFGNVTIDGTFFLVKDKQRIEVGRPRSSVLKDRWRGIDWDNLEDLYAVTPEIDAEGVEQPSWEKLEVTPVDAKRLKVYEDALFRPLITKPLAQSVKLMDMAKKQIKRKIQ